jgi:hypothetical protein
MTLTAAGRLLINKTNEETYQLDVNGTGRFTGQLTVKQPYTSATTPIYLGNTSFTAWNRNSYDTFILQQDDVTSFRMVEKNGELNTSDQVLAFSIGDGVGRIATSGQPLQFYVNGSPTGITYQGLSGTQVLVMNTNGNAQFNYALGVTGAATFSSLAGVGSRTVNASATGELSATSDSRLKQEDLDYKVEGLAEILQIQPRAYKWLSDIDNRGENATTEIGFFANEIASIIPSAAPMGNDGYYGFYDRAVIAALVKGMQEQQAQIQNLQEQINAK